MELRGLISEYLDSGKLMQIATSSDAQPWLAHVWYAHTPDLTSVVFTSNLNRRHSQEIRDNARVSLAFVAIELDGLGQKVRGLVCEGWAAETDGDECRAAYDLYAKRWPQVHDAFAVEDIIHGASPMRMYRVSPSRWVLFDEVNFPDAPRQELEV